METNIQKKIVHIIRSTSFGGLELYVYTLINQLSNQNIEQYVYCTHNSIFENKIKENKKIKILNSRSNLKISIKDISKLRSVIKSEKIDVVHVHTNKDVWLGSPACFGLNDTKLIFSLYMNVIAKKNIIHKLLYSQIDQLLSTSELINEDVAKKYPITLSKIKLQRYGRSVDEYTIDIEKRIDIRQQWQADKSKIVVGTMCRFDPSKGVKELIKSYIELSIQTKEKVEYWIIGERTVDYKAQDGTIVYEQESDQLYQEMISYIDQNNLNDKIKIIPFQKDLQGYLSAMDIFVLASYHEMYALAVLDALLMKLPVVGINSGGTPEQLANGRGILVEPKSAKAIAVAIDKSIEDIQPNENGHNWVKNEHDWKNIIPQYISRYSS